MCADTAHSSLPRKLQPRITCTPMCHRNHNSTLREREGTAPQGSQPFRHSFSTPPSRMLDRGPCARVSRVACWHQTPLVYRETAKNVPYVQSHGPPLRNLNYFSRTPALTHGIYKFPNFPGVSWCWQDQHASRPGDENRCRQRMAPPPFRDDRLQRSDHSWANLHSGTRWPSARMTAHKE